MLAKSISSRYRKILEAEWDQRYRDGEDHFVSERSLMLLSDWYYSTRGNATAQDHKFLFQSLLFQWLQQNPAIFELLAGEYRKKEPLSESRISAESLKNTIQKVVEQGIPILSIVDAIDESDNRRDSEIRRQDVLQNFLKMVTEIPNSKAKFIILSRSFPEIDDQLLQPRWRNFVQGIKMQENNSKAILQIVDSGMKSLRQQMGKFSGGEQPNLADSAKYSGIQQYLLENADGVILWVTVTIEAPKSLIGNGEDSFTKLEKKLHSLPKDLSELYRRIVDDLYRRLSSEEISETRRTLMWVSRGSPVGRLPLGALYEAISLPSLGIENLGDSSDPIFDDKMQFGNWKGFRRRLRLRCGPFLDVTAVKSRSPIELSRKHYHPNDTIQLLHRTVKDFLASPENAGVLHFTDSAAIEAIDEDTVKYLTFLEPRSGHSVQKEGPRAYLEKRRATIDDVLKFLEKRTLLSFLLQSEKLGPEALSQMIRCIFSRLSPLNSEIDMLADSTTTSLLLRINPFNAGDCGEFFAFLIQTLSIQLVTSPDYADFSKQSSLEDRFLVEIMFAELTYYACINGLPNVASILVNLWFPRSEGSKHFGKRRRDQQAALAAVAFLVTLEHGLTDICCKMISILKGPCVEWLCDIWHVDQKEFPGIPFKISLAEKFAVKAGHVDIIEDLVSSTWRCYRHEARNYEELIGERLLQYKSTVSLGPELSNNTKEVLDPRLKSECHDLSDNKQEVWPHVDVSRCGCTPNFVAAILRKEAVGMKKDERTDGQENAVKDEMLEALAVVAEHEMEFYMEEEESEEEEYEEEEAEE